MKYSFLIPTFNSDRWIQSCIDSILAQTYTGFNILIVDSGSTDGTLKWIREIGDSRIQIYATDTRLGIVENWQRFTAIPRTEFMTIMGHDDILYPHYLTTIDRLIEQNPKAGLYQTHFNFIDANGQVIRVGAPMKSHITPEALLEAVLQNKIEITATGFMVRSRQYDALGGIPAYPNLLYADIELWLKLIQDSYLAVAPENCFEFRLHVDNTSKSTGEFRLTAFEMLIDFFCKLKKENQAYQQLIERNGVAFLKNHVVGSCHKLIYIPLANRNQVSMNMIIGSAKRCATKLIPATDFKPGKFFGIMLAKLIDSNSLTRGLFLYYKSFQKRTF